MQKQQKYVKVKKKHSYVNPIKTLSLSLSRSFIANKMNLFETYKVPSKTNVYYTNHWHE